MSRPHYDEQEKPELPQPWIDFLPPEEDAVPCRLADEVQTIARTQIGNGMLPKAGGESSLPVERSLPVVVLLDAQRRDLGSAGDSTKATFEMPDGTYFLNDKGQIGKTASKDGSMTRTYKYEDPSDPAKVTSMNMNGIRELVRTGADNFAVYQIKDGTRTLTGNWRGELSISKDGILRFRAADETEYHHRGAATRDLSRFEMRRWSAAKDSSTGVGLSDKDAKENREGATKDSGKAGASDKALDGRKVYREDGIYERDEQGRVRTMISPDGKTKRAFKYEDPKNPDRITTEIVNDKKEYRYLGPVTVNGEPWKENGFEYNSYAVYENESLVGNWSGVRSVSRNGVHSTKESSSGAEMKHQTADGASLSESVRKARERYGIWPSKFQVTHEDGTEYTVKLKGTNLDSLTESRMVDGQRKTISWTRAGDKWTSDETPKRQRKNMEISRDGTLRYDDLDGIKHLHYKDGRRALIDGGITRSYDKSGKVTAITQPNGESRQFGYSGNELISITDRTKNGMKTWSRSAGSDVWKSGAHTETRKDLKIQNDGSVEYRLQNGNRIRLSRDFSKVELDSKHRPVRVEFESGSSRKFEYAADKLKSITDTIKQKDKLTERIWTRDGTSNNFVSEFNGKKYTRQVNENPSPNGDYKYVGKDKRQRVDQSKDLERRARGESLFTSESLQEAKDNLLDACMTKGIKTDRIEKYLLDFEKNATKWATKPEKLAKALDNLTQILASPEKSKHYTESQRKVIFETALHNLGRPMEIDQGYHPTCNVTTVEVYSAVRHPDEYARLCKEITLKGNYKTSDGKTVTPPKNALMPGEDERAYDLDKPNVNKRNFASQIVQMTLINGAYELGHVVKQGRVLTDTRYVMEKISWQNIGGGRMRKVGEDRLADKHGNPRGSDSGPDFTQTEVLAASKLMLGYEMPYIKGPTSPDGHNWTFDLPTRDRLLKAKENGRLPLGVPTIGGQHVQTIHDVTVDKSGTLWVLLDNQHGEAKDGWITLADLHRTQRDGDYECVPKIKPWQKVNR
jgi:YD repeat-containing protein